MTTPDHLALESLDIAADRIAKLREDFPEAFRDGKIDFDTLKRALGDWVEPENERFGLQWPGKAAAFQAVQTPSVATLLPDPEHSVNWGTTQNLIIEGDNLEVLKLLQKSYYGKVKMIYIDPPYNTGNDFIYPDNYREGLQSYLEFTGQVNSEGKKLSTNTESEGRFHSNWLNMMYPRLYLARNLLRDDGVIFVSIDDSEFANLRELMNAIFGEENFIATIIWQKKYSVSNDDPGIAPMHDYIVSYRRSERFLRNLLPRSEKQNARYSNPDNDPKGPWTSGEYVSSKSKAERPTLWYPITHPVTGKQVWPDENAVWRYTQDKHIQIEAEGRLFWGTTGNYSLPRLKRYLHEVQQGIVPSTWWPYEEAGHNDQAQKETSALVGRKVFDTPKPTSLISRLINIGSLDSSESIILDFFAGSGSTGHAVMQQNAEDNGNRQYILVQLPEPIDPPKTLDDGTTLTTIADITRERVRRAGRKIAAEGKSVDTGFRSYRLATSNFAPWDGTPPPTKQAALDLGLPASDPAKQISLQLQAFTENVLPDRTEDDILAEIILRLGYELTVPVERLTMAGQQVFSIDSGAILSCLDSSLSLALFEEMVARDPGQIVCLDSAFGDDDELKVNATQIIRSRARSEEASIKFWVV